MLIPSKRTQKLLILLLLVLSLEEIISQYHIMDSHQSAFLSLHYPFLLRPQRVMASIRAQNPSRVLKGFNYPRDALSDELRLP
jgi:hypothetical protein